MPTVTETGAACAGADMTPIGHTAGQIADDARGLIATFCDYCPPAEKTRCATMRDGASGIWGGRHYPDKKGQVT